jgi:uncharacterized membrane protein YbhN (UPF0104 family)
LNSNYTIIKITLSKIAQYKSSIFFVSKILIAAGLLSFILSKIEPAKLWQAIITADPFYLIFSFSLTAVNLFLQYRKWKITCCNFLGECKDKNILYSLFAGLSAGAFTPARVGEYFGRAIAFKDKPLIRVAFSTFIDKLYPLIIISFWGSISSVLFLHYYYHVIFYLTASLFIIIFIFFYFLILFLIKPFKIDVLFERFFSRSKKLFLLKEIIYEYRNIDMNYSLKMILYSILFCTCYTLQFALMVIAFSHKIRIVHFLWAGNLVMFVKSVVPSISLAEIGIREGAAIFFLGRMGETAVTAFNASIFILFINIFIPALIGLYFLFKREPFEQKG